MKTAKSFISIGLTLLLLLFTVVPNCFSQLQEAIEELTGENTKGYLQPFVNSFSNNINSGIYRTAHVSKVGLHFYVGLAGMVTMIPDEALIYMGIPPLPFPQNSVETASVFGGAGAVVEGAQGLAYTFQNGQIQGDLVPFAVPQLELGSIMGTMVKVRYFSAELPGSIGESIGKIKLTGYGLQHSISQYIPLFPIDLSVGFLYQTFDIGDIISTNALSYGVQASKSLPLLTLYGCVSMENTKMDVSYTYQAGSISEEISLELKSENKFRITVGARLKLAFLQINGDFTMGKQNTFVMGIGFGI